VSDLVFRSGDGLYGLRLTHACIPDLLDLCSHAGGGETGGILIGYYTEALDTAVVTTATGPPPDSKGGRDWFKRGVKGLRERLEEDWNARQEFYLGEWHFHPSELPKPSTTDDDRLERIAVSPQYECNSPVLLIIGCNSGDEWLLGAYVYPRGGSKIRLVPCH
jgi:integrative and conjugative element protein (TIGR02256 family)